MSNLAPVAEQSGEPAAAHAGDQPSERASDQPRFAVIVFPGSNCDVDMLAALADVMGAEAAAVRHDATSLDGFDAVMLPGGFSYGDYLRPGAIARFAPIMAEVARFAAEGKPVFGTCNGFQVLTEAGLLPGTLLPNKDQRFICKSAGLQVANADTIFTSDYEDGEVIALPVAHGEGNYFCDEETLEQLRARDQIAFTYHGDNDNGSLADIAGITNEAGNVLGMMPHPERAVEDLLGSSDGKRFFSSLIGALKAQAKAPAQAEAE